MSSCFLSAATEVKIMFLQYITQPTDLKALCLVFKEVSAIVIPVLYHQVDLTPRERTHDEHCDDLDPIPLEQIRRVQSLLRKKQNLLYIRILVTSECGTVVTDMLNELLANLVGDQLVELYYGNRGLLSTNKLLLRTENCFPTPEQIKLIWTRQRKLQTFHSRHIPTLFVALGKNTLEASAVLRPVKELILIEEPLDLDTVIWPLENVYMSSLRKLKLARWHSQQNLQSLHNLFWAKAFLNLTDLYLRNVIIRTELQLVNCPSLRSLTIIHCRGFPDGATRLSIPQLLQIKCLYYTADSDIDQYKLLLPILSQIQGLESLVLELISPECEDEDFSEELINGFRTELAYALEMQQGTLTELVVCEKQGCETRLAFAGEEIFRAIQGCGRLYRLAVALGVEDPVPCYSRLIQDLPHLAYYWLMHCYDYSPDYQDEEEIPTLFKKEIPAQSKLRFFAYRWSCYSRQECKIDELTTDQDGEPDSNTAGAPFKRISWKKANAIFYNQYPCVPLLPLNLESSDELLGDFGE